MFLIFDTNVVIFLQLAIFFWRYFQHKILKNKDLTFAHLWLLGIKKPRLVSRLISARAMKTA